MAQLQTKVSLSTETVIESTATLGARQLLIQSNAVATNYTSTALTTVTTTGTITVPAAQTGILVATFNAESQCTGVASSWCAVLILCDGVALSPVNSVNTDFAFSSGGGEKYVGASMTGYSNPVSGGSHTCQVQTAIANGATSHRLDDWTFRVEFWRQS